MFPKRSKRLWATAACCFATALSTAACASDLADRFDLHGYGFQDYVQTSGNQYLGADARGNWDVNFLGLVMSAQLNDRSKLWAQLESSSEATRFTWFFVDYQFSDTVRAHAGRVKLPLGLYNETIDAKSLQVSQLEPSLYQVGADMVHDAYHGLGLDVEHDVGGGHLVWQIYAGNIYDLEPPVDSKDRRVFGGRVSYRTPVAGLRLMVSTYRTQVEKLADKSLSNEDRFIGSMDFVQDAYEIKAEYGHHEFFDVTSDAYYVQGRYSFLDKWSSYARYDHLTADKDRSSDPSYYQNTWVVGLGYRLRESLEVRLENHFNHGYALPVASEEVAPGAGKLNWNLVVAGIDFIF